jgi:F-type H+-transporting ATPase subunit delta
MRGCEQEVAEAYAKALVEAFRDAGELEGSIELVSRLVEAIAPSPRIRTFLEGPHIQQEAKEKAIRSAFGSKLHPLLVRFCLLMVRRHRTPCLVDALRSYRALALEAMGVASGTVVSAVELDSTERQRLQRAVEKRLGRRVALSFERDEAVIGGFKVTVGDRVYDGTLRGKLEALEERLRARGSRSG